MNPRPRHILRLAEHSSHRADGHIVGSSWRRGKGETHEVISGRWQVRSQNPGLAMRSANSGDEMVSGPFSRLELDTVWNRRLAATGCWP